MKLTFLTILLFLTLFTKGQIDTIKEIQTADEIEKLSSDIKEIRRDQLNYKIEKDLLKETYSSNYSMIQIFISIILGVFAVLAYLGLKSIMTLKKEYDIELAKLRDVKISFEAQLKTFSDSQIKIEERVKSIDIQNETQNSKIKILEVREKVNSLFIQKSYSMALEYVNAGLEIAKDDLQLLINRAKILNKLKSFSEAVEAHKKVLIFDPKNDGISLDLAELYLIVNQPKTYEIFVKSIQEAFAKRDTFVTAYFDAFKYYRLGDQLMLNSIITKFMVDKDLTVNHKQEGWGFEEFNEQMDKETSTEIQKTLKTFVNYLGGFTTGDELMKLV